MTSAAAVRIVELEEALRAALAGDRGPGERYFAMRALGGAGQRVPLCAPIELLPYPEDDFSETKVVYQDDAVATVMELSQPTDWFLFSCKLRRARVIPVSDPPDQLLWQASKSAPLAAEHFHLPLHRVRAGDVLQLYWRSRPSAQVTSVAIYGYRVFQDNIDNDE